MDDNSDVMCKEDDGNVITLEEFIEEETRLETDAQAVLGPSDDKNCTYNQGYMGRQALYSCKTCREDENSRVAGVCLACTYHCHEGHEFIELYTKRNFRCDCGNRRFNNSKCNLQPNKVDENTDNKYNDNFEGLYCTCKKPYPDADDSVPDEMIQCIVCEDWYHTRHLNAEVPGEENYAEMICSDCTERLSFLNKYLGYSVTKISKVESSSIDVMKTSDSSSAPVSNDDDHRSSNDLIQSNSENILVQTDNDFIDIKNSKVQINGCSILPVKDENRAGNTVCDKPESETNNSAVPNEILCRDDAGNSLSHIKDNKSKKNSDFVEKLEVCLLDSLKEVAREVKGATFWPDNFRTLLCTCLGCKEMYRNLDVSYITDVSDTIVSYEEQGRNKLLVAGGSNCSPSNLTYSHDLKNSTDGVLSMLSKMGMDRFSQAEAILNYNDMKSNLMSYLSKFAENKKIVREEDIHEFFTQMKARKRQKIQQNSFSCR